jgi:hypothetical protein
MAQKECRKKEKDNKPSAKAGSKYVCSKCDLKSSRGKRLCKPVKITIPSEGEE